jgi:ribonuclease T2
MAKIEASMAWQSLAADRFMPRHLTQWLEQRNRRAAYRRHRFGRAVRLTALAGLMAGWLGGPSAVAAQDFRPNEPGNFDYYVLVLSWSPSFCAANAERTARRPPAADPECGPRPYSFVVHGLWPQYERGFPQDCQVPAPRLSRAIVGSMLNLMPSPNLIYHEWDRHGTCSGLPAKTYFETIRQARAAVTIPAQYRDLPSPLTVSPDDVEKAFMDANPGLGQDGIVISCGGRRLDEVRICMNRDLTFRDCPELARRSCRRDRLVMPPVRGR